jgi:hypothetical protein
MSTVKLARVLPRLAALCVGAGALVLLVEAAGAPITHQQAGSDIFITLNNDFIKKYKDRVTIETQFMVDRPAPKPHPPSEDGDEHVAGRSNDVGLPIVAEIMNAKTEAKAVSFVQKAAKNHQPIQVAGAWRIWCEHAGGRPQVQGQKVDPATTSNPDHVFEIHPLSRVGDIDTRKSFQPIQGYRPKEAHTAFLHYENVKCRIIPGDNTTTIRTSTAGYNIVQFKLQSLEEPNEQRVTDDGRFVMCQVHDLEGELVVRKVRMAFVKGTPPEEAVKNLANGKRLTVLGIPRIDLALVSYRVQHQGDESKPLEWNLPYEIIVVAVFPGEEDGSDD